MDELTIQISMQPWYTELLKEISPILVKAVSEGMPTDTAKEIFKDIARDALHDGIVVE